MHKPEPNYFYVNRGLLQSARWLSEPFTRGQAWVDLFGLAQHSKGFFRVRGIRVDVERGQLAYSQLTLSQRWKWSRGKVIRYLKELENDGDIVQQSNEVTTLITILKYDKWQGDGTTNDTTDGQQKDNRRYTYNNDNNDNNENKGEYSLTLKSFNKRSDITDTILKDISELYEVPVEFVADCWDSACNWLDAKGKVQKNYKAFLSNWVKRDKASLILKSKRGGGYSGTRITKI